MKRKLFQNIMVLPFASGSAVDRDGYLSAVIGADVSANSTLTITIEHSDDGETFEAVTDEHVFPEQRTESGEYTFTNPAVDGAEDVSSVVNIDVDLVGLKKFIKFTVTGAESLALVLGDSNQQPV